MDQPSLQLSIVVSGFLKSCPGLRAEVGAIRLCHWWFRWGSEVHQVTGQSACSISNPSLLINAMFSFLFSKLKKPQNKQLKAGQLTAGAFPYLQEMHTGQPGLCLGVLPPASHCFWPAARHRPGVTSLLSTLQLLLTFTAGSKRSRMRLQLQF